MLLPGMIALVAYGVHANGIDERLSGYFFDSSSAEFFARNSTALEVLGHRFAKSAVAAVWLTLLATAGAVRFIPRLSIHQGLLWTTLAAMALGPTIVVVLKEINSIHCPWDLKRFGGYAEPVRLWFVARTYAARCFPGGHAAGGFSLIALAFAARAAGNSRWYGRGLIATIAAGNLFSLVRIAQGAHFLSHNLWSAAIDWCAAALVFTVFLRSRQHAPRQTLEKRPCNHAPGELPDKKLRLACSDCYTPHASISGLGRAGSVKPFRAEVVVCLTSRR
jgi:membrane-associated PAP2 superfamily phosphatase